MNQETAELQLNRNIFGGALPCEVDFNYGPKQSNINRWLDNSAL